MALDPTLLGLLHGCKEQPDDDLTRLVLADWLDDQGEAARADLVRAQCRLAVLGTGSAEAAELGVKVQRLLRTQDRHWLGALWEAPWHWEFKRGLLGARLSWPQLSAWEACLLAGDDLPWVEHLGGR